MRALVALKHRFVWRKKIKWEKKSINRKMSSGYYCVVVADDCSSHSYTVRKVLFAHVNSPRTLAVWPDQLESIIFAFKILKNPSTFFCVCFFFVCLLIAVCSGVLYFSLSLIRAPRDACACRDIKRRVWQLLYDVHAFIVLGKYLP